MNDLGSVDLPSLDEMGRHENRKEGRKTAGTEV